MRTKTLAYAVEEVESAVGIASMLVMFACLTLFLVFPHPLVCVVGYGAYLSLNFCFFELLGYSIRFKRNLLEIAVIVMVCLVASFVWKNVPEAQEEIAAICTICWCAVWLFLIYETVRYGLEELRTGSSGEKALRIAGILAMLLFAVVMPVLSSVVFGGYAAGITMLLVPIILMMVAHAIHDDSHDCCCCCCC
jgi:hypothetical protein